MSNTLRGFRLLLSFSFKVVPWRAALFLLSGVVMSLIFPVAAYASKLLIDAAVAKDLNGALLAALILAVTMALGVINTLYYVDLLFTVAEQAGAEADRRLIHLMAATPGIEHHELPAYLDRLDLLREDRRLLGWMTNAMAGLLRVVVLLVSSGILLAGLHPALLLLPLFGVFSFLAGRKGQQLHQKAEEESAEAERLRKHLFDLATSAASGKEVRVFDLDRDLLARHHAAAERVYAKRDRAEWQSAALQVIDAIISAGTYVAAIGLVLLLALRGQATPGDVVLAIGLAAGMNAIVFTAVMYGTSFLRVLRAAGRFLWLEDYARQTSKPPTNPVPVPTRITAGIELRDLSFSYPGAKRPVLDGISLQLPAGAVVALVGENGAGKTTLAKLLCRFYEPTGGSMLVDGTDMSRFSLDDWHEHIAAAFQDFTRFELLVRETVGVGKLDQIEAIPSVEAALARAGATDLATRLPLGLETQLGRAWDGGVDLSGGQWQKLALSRAMMRAAPLLLVLDEPTASLDAQSEHDLFERYAAAAKSAADQTGTITLLVSHRFSTVRMADLIVVLENGKIREAGSHAELMIVNGLYAELYKLQAVAYRS